MQGAPTDIRTGMPLSDTGNDEAAAAIRKAQLQEKMRMAGISETEAGRAVINEIEGVLTALIADILKTDAQAQACVKILKAVGGREIIARRAAKEYIERFF